MIDTQTDRLAQVEAGTAPATPWQTTEPYGVIEAYCANKAAPTWIDYGPDPTGAECPRCEEVHPQE